jgi:hypothetical protein
LRANNDQVLVTKIVSLEEGIERYRTELEKTLEKVNQANDALKQEKSNNSELQK